MQQRILKPRSLAILCVFFFLHQFCIAQNVGIGTAAPEAKLHIAGITPAGNSILKITDSSRYPMIGFSAPGVTNNWNIMGGLHGTDSTNMFNIVYRVVSGASNYLTNFLSINGNGQVSIPGGIFVPRLTNWLQVGAVPNIFSGNQLALGIGNQGMSFAQYANSSTWYSNTNFAIMSNTGSGYLGIGTQAPTAPLHIYSTSNINTPNILIEQPNADYARLAFKSNTANAFTLTAIDGGTSLGLIPLDTFNIYSNRLNSNLFSITSTQLPNATTVGVINLNANTNFSGATYCTSGRIIVPSGSINNNVWLSDNTYFILGDDNTSGSTSTITGFIGGQEGRIVYLVCVSINDHSITLKKQDGRSSYGNQIFNPGGDVTLTGFNAVTLMYTSNYWVIISKNF